jgi:predicted small secreted protein
MFKRIVFLMLIAAVALTLTACQTQKGSAKDLLPVVPNTNVVEGETITQFLTKVADGAALAATNPELIPLIQRVEASLTCYQGLGAVALRTYTDKTFPLSAGIVAIIDRNALTNPTNFANCVLGRAQASNAAAPTIDPCVKNYTLKKDDNEFYIAYIATTKEMCTAFCSKLEGCTGQ